MSMTMTMTIFKIPLFSAYGWDIFSLSGHGSLGITLLVHAQVPGHMPDDLQLTYSMV